MNTVYLLTDPRTDAPRYVGVTKDLKRRGKDHLRGCGVGPYCKNWIKLLCSVGIRPIVIILEIVPDHQRKDAEQAWILGFRQIGARLTNLTDGGEGTLGRKLSSETRAKISAALTGLQGQGKSPEHRAKISAALMGRVLSTATREKMSAARKGRVQSAETRAKMSIAQMGNRKGIGNKSRLGQKHSAETRKKMSASQRAKTTHKSQIKRTN